MGTLPDSMDKARVGRTSARSVMDHRPTSPEDASDMWQIHGRVYDLTTFVGRHPGGSQVLKSVKGSGDLTAIFESSHALADRAKIDRVMNSFYLRDCEPTAIQFPVDGFYKKVTQQVRLALPSSGPRATRWWCFKAAVLTAAWAASFMCAFFGGLSSSAPQLSSAWRCAIAILSGHMFISVGFVVMHDASHSAVSASPRINTNLSWLWNAIACWDHRLWHKHHVYRHHSFTGDIKRDPDTIHLTPFLRKHVAQGGPPSPMLSRMAPWTASVLFVNLLPGMFLGQAISYARWWQRGRLWRMEVCKTAEVDLGAVAIRGLILSLYATSPLVTLSYVLAMNWTYAMCILPDHDTQETREAASATSSDWGEEQVRNSANFATSNPLVCGLYGGINFQIEHHLFPTLSHVHYATIQPVVKAACAEFGLPYVEHPTILSAYASTLRAIATATRA